MTNTGDTYQQQAYNYVRDKILSMAYKPGDRIADSSIAKLTAAYQSLDIKHFKYEL